MFWLFWQLAGVVIAILAIRLLMFSVVIIFRLLCLPFVLAKEIAESLRANYEGSLLWRFAHRNVHICKIPGCTGAHRSHI